MAADERERASWQDFGDAVDALQKAIAGSGFDPECIIAIARGGLIVGGALAHKLDIKDIYALNVEYYKGSGLDDVRMEAPVVVGPPLDPQHFAGRNVLVVDDVAESGITLKFVNELLVEAKAVKSAVWFTKPQTEVVPDYSAAETAQWIVFPWSPFA